MARHVKRKEDVASQKNGKEEDKDARTARPDEDHFTMAGSDGGGGCNLLFASLSEVDV
jgi:hypothetical protein